MSSAASVGSCRCRHRCCSDEEGAGPSSCSSLASARAGRGTGKGGRTGEARDLDADGAAAAALDAEEREEWLPASSGRSRERSDGRRAQGKAEKGTTVGELRAEQREERRPANSRRSREASMWPLRGRSGVDAAAGPIFFFSPHQTLLQIYSRYCSTLKMGTTFG